MRNAPTAGSSSECGQSGGEESRLASCEGYSGIGQSEGKRRQQGNEKKNTSKAGEVGAKAGEICCWHHKKPPPGVW
ncbi:MAG: hypothetical protein MUC60_04170 [Oscillatoria sp. Prado101]|nr:hypothetical protein [Oscillatoria sp. Prado101]